MTSLHIEGFKAIGDATLHWHPRVNVITGPNNSGKTTVLEALALWVESFNRISFQAAKAITNRGVRRGDWYLDSVQVHHTEVVSVRSPGFDDLFHRDSSHLALTATLEDDAGEFSVPLHVRKARGGNYEFECKGELRALNPRLNASCRSWPRPFRVFFASPVAAVLTSEEFLTPGKTADMIRQRRSAEVLRNRIHTLYGLPTGDFERFRSDVSRILGGEAGEIYIEVRGNPNTSVQAQVLAKSNPRDQLRDISLLGSGSLQIIEVLLNLYLEPADLNLVLLDEPDSHIHRDIQRRLLEVIEGKSEHAQVFATTHNESLLRNVGWDRVFHLTPAPVDAPKVFRPVASAQLMVTGRQHGLLASPLRNVLSSVGAETALDFLNALEAQHFLLVEGASDAVLLDRMFDIARFGGPRETAMYWCLNGIDGGLRSLAALKIILENIRNARSLWGKARVILDRDLLTPEHSDEIIEALGKHFGLRACFWKTRTVEAVLLSGGPSSVLAALLHRVGETNLQQKLEGNADEACMQAWTTLGSRLSQKWGEALNLEHLHGSLAQRLETLNQALPKGKSLSGGVGKLQNSVLNFHRQSIAAGEYWHSADKNDVAEFVAEALQHMGLPQVDAQNWRQGPNWFQAVVMELRHTADFPALQAMRETLRQSR